jgi:glutamine cyclotransferase
MGLSLKQPEWLRMSLESSLVLRRHIPRRLVLAAPLSMIVEASGMEAQRLSALEDLGVTELENRTHHVQGIVVDGGTLWVSSVSKPAEAGYLHEFNLHDGTHRATVEIQEGTRYHPGGIDQDGDTLWVPVAEYRPLSTSTMLQIDKRSRKVVSRFEVEDHIGCVAVCGDRLIGGNWDARHFYYWSRDGRLLDKKENPGKVAYQDLKYGDGMLLASGNVSREEGAIDWLDPDTLQLRKRILSGKTDRGVRFTNEGMAVVDGKLYLLPEDGPSRLFVFKL